MSRLREGVAAAASQDAGQHSFPESGSCRATRRGLAPTTAPPVAVTAPEGAAVWLNRPMAVEAW